MSAATRYRLLLDALRQRVREISPTEALRWMQEERGEEICIDLRHPRHWAAGHLPRAIHLEFGRFPSEIESKIPSSDTPILCYSRAGSRSLIAVDLLLQMGFSIAYSLAGGWEAWQKAGLPSEVGSLPACRPPDERLAGIAQLPHLIDSIRHLSTGYISTVTPFIRKEDRAVMEFLCIEPKTMEQIVLSAASDDAIVARLKGKLGPSWPSDHAIREFNVRVLHRHKSLEALNNQ
ncbi:MAG: rhodanese-like domain-containing protein [Candidatus Methylacidiphilaceae bacterium]